MPKLLLVLPVALLISAAAPVKQMADLSCFASKVVHILWYVICDSGGGGGGSGGGGW
jgi:hypothetical protein